jgi:protein-arginine kinase activator protein McsA
MKNLKIGDQVIALTNPQGDYAQKRVKGNIYTVKDVLYCHSCGSQKINIGMPKIKHNTVGCNCGAISDNKGLGWTSSNLFVKVDDIHNAIDVACEVEDYETAAMLRDINKP